MPVSDKGFICDQCHKRVGMVLIGFPHKLHPALSLLSDTTVWCDECAKSPEQAMNELRQKIMAEFPQLRAT